MSMKYFTPLAVLVSAMISTTEAIRVTTQNMVLNETEDENEECNTIRHLPAFGYKALYPDFQWPTEEMLAEMSPDVKLQSIKFASTDKDAPLSHAQVTLTDGSQSPYFGADNYPEPANVETIVFDSETPIREVESTELNYIYGLNFYDEDRALIYDYEVYNMPSEKFASYNSYDIRENEEIIGVYGSLNGKYKTIWGLGFIVKSFCAPESEPVPEFVFNP